MQSKHFCRRRFLKYLSYYSAAAALAPALPAFSASEETLVLATWPNYHNPDNFKRFAKETGITVEQRIFGSNEEMLAAMVTGQADFDVVVATNYTISSYAQMGLISPLQEKWLPEFSAGQNDPRFLADSLWHGARYGIPKNWGTTGYVYDSRYLKTDFKSWRQFWDSITGDARHRVSVHDYQLTAIGNALKYFGYSFNSTEPRELADAEALLLKCRPYLRAISSLAVEEIQQGAWMAMAWTGDAVTLQKTYPSVRYVIGEEGGEIWCDYYTVTAASAKSRQAHALVNFLQRPEVNYREVQAHGYPPTDRRVLALLPKQMLDNPVLFPPEALLRNLEFGSAETLRDTLRAEILRRFKSG